MRERAKVRYYVVVPAYNEAASLPELCARIEETFAALGAKSAFRIVIVDDGSTDGTAAAVRNLARLAPHIELVQLRRNCGKSLALMAGFRRCHSGVVFTMDADLQDRPEDIPLLLKRLDEGYDLVCGARQKRQDKFVRKIGSRLYNWTVRKISGLNIQDLNCGFKAYRFELIRNLVVFGQYHRYIPLIAHLAGFRVGEAPVGNDSRKYGSSKFRTLRYQGLFDLLSILFTQKYGLSPLHFFGVMGVLLMLPSFLVICYFVLSQVLYLSGFGTAYMVGSRPLLTLALSVFLIGIVVFLVGFICDFILHHQVRERIDSIIALSTKETDEPEFDEKHSGNGASRPTPIPPT